MPRHCFYDSPIGRLLLIADKQKLCALHFANSIGRVKDQDMGEHDESCFSEVLQQLSEYFEGNRRVFSVPLATRGTTFQQRVWTALQSITYGSTSSYSEIAELLGNPKASRAVGLANSKNPIPIIIPCHRVIGKDHSLTGFSGGLAIKQKLLELEGIILA